MGLAAKILGSMVEPSCVRDFEDKCVCDSGGLK
jgi:hypothetical protein